MRSVRGQRFGGGGVAGWRIKQPAGFTAVCELLDSKFSSGEKKEARLVGGALSSPVPTSAKTSWTDWILYNRLQMCFFCKSTAVLDKKHAIKTDKVRFTSGPGSRQQCPP